MEVKKRLVFHFYQNEGWEENFANILHYKCLKHYSHLFDESLIIISTDFDPCSDEVIEAKRKLASCIKSPLTIIKVKKNSAYCEGGTFKEEVVDHLDKIDGLVFFAHNKGVSCMSSNGAYDPDSLSVWICGMYFYCLEFLDEVISRLCVKTVAAFYGAFFMYAEWIRNASHTWYSGTFFWINPGRVLKWANKIPEIFDREYAEWFPGEVFGQNITYNVASRNNVILSNTDLYFHARDVEPHLGSCEEDRINFKRFLKDIAGI